MNPVNPQQFSLQYLVHSPRGDRADCLWISLFTSMSLFTLAGVWLSSSPPFAPSFASSAAARRLSSLGSGLARKPGVAAHYPEAVAALLLGEHLQLSDLGGVQK